MQPPETVEQFANRTIYQGFPYASEPSDRPAINKTARVPLESYGLLTLTASNSAVLPDGTYILSAVLRREEAALGNPYKSLRLSVHISDQGEDEPWFEAAPPDPNEGNEKAVVFDFIDPEKRDSQGRPVPKLFDITDLQLLELRAAESRLIQQTP